MCRGQVTLGVNSDVQMIVAKKSVMMVVALGVLLYVNWANGRGSYQFLLINATDLEVLFQGLISLFSQSSTFGMISRSEMKLHVQSSPKGTEEVGNKFCSMEVMLLGTLCLEKT